MDLLIVGRAEKSSPPFQLDNCNYCAGESYGASSIEPQGYRDRSIHSSYRHLTSNQPKSHTGITNIDNVHSKNDHRLLITHHPSGSGSDFIQKDHLLCQTTRGWSEGRLPGHTATFNAVQFSGTHLREVFREDFCQLQQIYKENLCHPERRIPWKYFSLTPNPPTHFQSDQL